MKRTITTLLLSTLSLCYALSQELFYLLENFERTDSAYYWTVDPYIANKTWKYTYGGQWKSGGDPYNPEIPVQGNFNAGIYFPALELDSIKLVTPTLELDGAVKPMLRFWHCQYTKILKGPDFLRLLFRAGPNSQWNVIESWTDDISYWKEEVYDIANIGSQYLSDTFQIAFEGIIGNGYGVYIDSVSVLEEESVPMFVKNTEYSSVNHTMVPSNATDIPFERIKMRVLGNSGEARLNSLTLTPQGTGVEHLGNTFKLFYTRGDAFAPYISDTSTLIATGTKVGGNIVFTGINYKLLLGDNNLWVAASVKNTLKGQKTVSFTVPANGIQVSDTTFPATVTPFSKNHVLRESVFYDNFETGAPGWLLQGNFEVGWPEGNQVDIQSNPKTPYNGLNILATDLDGGYLPNINESTAYYAYTPVFDLTYYIKIAVYMHSFFSVNGPDNAVIEYSTNNGASWQNIWTSDQASNNSYWTEFIVNSIDSLCRRQPNFQLRFGITESMLTPWPGISVDNFAIIGEKLYTDVGVVGVIEPHNECIGCGNDTVKAWFKNFAVGAAPNAIPVYYGLWGADSTLVRDTLYGGINIGDSVLFTFSQLANFPKGDYYNKFVVGTGLAGDQDPSNDKYTKPLIIQDFDTPPDFEDFEYKGGIWLPDTGSRWECKIMSGTIPTDPLSPNIWVLSATGNYSNNDTSYVVSGCYDFSDISRNIVRMKYWSDCEDAKDGARLEYSTDNGVNWYIVNDTIYGAGWNWTTDYVDALGSNGWSGQNVWKTAQALLPVSADSGSKVKFRLIFMSDEANSFPQGFAFDDFEFFPAPADIGVSSIVMPADACFGTNPPITSLYIKNLGYNNLNINDTIIIGVDFENNQPVIDTFLLSADLIPGDSVLHTITMNFNIEQPGLYNIKAYTLIEDDPFFYQNNNDTLSYTFNIWPNPTIILADTLGSRQPDTLWVKPQYPDWVPGYTYLWHDNVTTDSIFDVVSTGLHWVTVTEPVHGCVTTDTIDVVVLYFDAGATEVVYPVSTCELDSTEYIQVRVTNVGTDSLVAGDKVAVSYSVNGSEPVYDTVDITAPLRFSNSLVYTFAENPFDFSEYGTYSITVSASYVGGDFNTANDAHTAVVNAYGYTPLDLGPDLVVKALDYVLDAGTGFESYSWNTGDTTQTTYIDEAGTYWVAALDANGCPGNDTVDIWFKIRDIMPETMLSPQNSCDRTGPEPIELRFRNNGTDTITPADIVTLKYSINSGAYISETFSPTNNILPGGQATRTSENTFDFSNYQDYVIDIVTTSTGDLRPGNDSLRAGTSTRQTPAVNLGEDKTISAFQYILDAGTGPNYSYLWQDKQTNTQTYTASITGNYYCVVTDTTTGCYGSDTVYLFFDINDYGIHSVSVPNQVCEGNRSNVSVELINSGNLPRTGAILNVAFSINGNDSVTQQFEINSLWMPGFTQTVTLSGPMPFNTVGSNNLRVFLDGQADINSNNDDLEKSIFVLAAPVVNFGGDTLRVAMPHRLDPGLHESYQWQDNSTNRYFTVNMPGNYSVIVTNAANCITTKAVFVDRLSSISNAIPESLDVKLYPNPANDILNIEANIKLGGELLVEIYDIRNQLVFSDKHKGFAIYSHQLDVNTMPAGVYFIRFRNNQLYYITKFVIE
ncbi:MAG: T9SS type A sorting domain-containing protein [Bacteroidales bacterium]|nr:T9SS type A sorting domain-containing protein [Bacteroidales bacterium]